VGSADEYGTCPGLRGTHLDWTLGIEERLDHLVGAATLREMAAQLTHQVLTKQASS
jgi:beta-glucosidase